MKEVIFVPIEDLADMHRYDRKRIARHLGEAEGTAYPRPGPLRWLVIYR